MFLVLKLTDLFLFGHGSYLLLYQDSKFCVMAQVQSGRLAKSELKKSRREKAFCLVGTQN